MAMPMVAVQQLLFRNIPPSNLGLIGMPIAIPIRFGILLQGHRWFQSSSARCFGTLLGQQQKRLLLPHGEAADRP